MKVLKLTIVFLLLPVCSHIYAHNNTDSTYKNFPDSSYSKMIDSVMKNYNKQMGEYEKKTNQSSNKRGSGNSLFGVTIDLILGANFSNTSFSMNRDTAGLSNTSSKTGPIVGANINLRLLGFAFGTGIVYTSKGFATSNSTYNANYFNIPLLFAYNFNIKRVEVDLSAGPYVGILLSQDKSTPYQLKNIDIGITGAVQGSYLFNKYLGVLLGVKYEQGGLNNLLKATANNPYISSIKTTNWYVYSGVKFTL